MKPTSIARSAFAFFLSCGFSALSLDEGYAATLLFQDTFTNRSLDASKWLPFICGNKADHSEGGWPWSYQPGQPRPSSSCDRPNGHIADYDLPANISTGSGLCLKAQAGTSATGYSWTSATICSYPVTNLFATNAGFTFTNGYVEVRAKIPSNNGSWSSIWFMPGPGSAGGEIDLQESGYLMGKTNPVSPDQVMACNYHAPGNSPVIINTGTDLSADYHRYGMEYLNGKSIKMFLDGALVASFATNISSGSYYIILNNKIASPATKSWHSQTNNLTPNPIYDYVSYVKVYDSRP